MTGWTEENKKLAIDMWNDGKSASIIAAELHCGSRNAVIGMIHRLKAKGDVKLRDFAPKQKAPRVYRIKRKEQQPQPPQLPPVTDEFVDAPLRASLTDLKVNECHFPVTIKGHHFFCGKPADGTYCLLHKKMTTQTPRQLQPRGYVKFRRRVYRDE